MHFVNSDALKRRCRRPWKKLKAANRILSHWRLSFSPLNLWQRKSSEIFISLTCQDHQDVKSTRQDYPRPPREKVNLWTKLFLNQNVNIHSMNMVINLLETGSIRMSKNFDHPKQDKTPLRVKSRESSPFPINKVYRFLTLLMGVKLTHFLVSKSLTTLGLETVARVARACPKSWRSGLWQFRIIVAKDAEKRQHQRFTMPWSCIGFW